MKFYFFLTVFLSVLFTGCKEDDKDPEINNSLSSLSGSTFLASADVLEKGEYGITDHGFVFYIAPEIYSQTVYPASQTISLGAVIEHDTFCSIIDISKLQFTYYNNLKCFVRAYIKNKRGTVYSDYAWEPIPLVQVSGIYPSSAEAGDTIFINGQNFETDVTLNTVIFNSVTASVVSVTPTRLHVVVPGGIYYDSWNPLIDIRVKSGGQTTDLYDVFRLLPTVNSFSPSSGTWNTPIIVHGSGLVNSSVMINNEFVGYSSNSSTLISAYVPYSVNTKKFKIYVSADNGITEVPGGYFTMENMTIEPLTSLTYFPGNSINISGTGFNPGSEKNKLIMGEHSIPSNYGSTNNLEFSLPASLATGTYSSYITNGLDTARIVQPVTIVKPVISSMSPNSAYPGSLITLTGTRLMLNGDFYPTIYFGRNSINLSSADNNELNFRVPDSAPGSYTIKAVYGFFEVYCAEEITVLEPVVTAISPSTGNNGTSVIIEGEGFGSENSLSVYFGNAKAELLSASGNRINVKVPLHLTPGVYLVQVYMNSYKLTTNVNFNIL